MTTPSAYKDLSLSGPTARDMPVTRGEWVLEVRDPRVLGAGGPRQEGPRKGRGLSLTNWKDRKDLLESVEHLVSVLCELSISVIDGQSPFYFRVPIVVFRRCTTRFGLRDAHRSAAVGTQFFDVRVSLMACVDSTSSSRRSRSSDDPFGNGVAATPLLGLSYVGIQYTARCAMVIVT
eukprot:gene107-biopygen226